MTELERLEKLLKDQGLDINNLTKRQRINAISIANFAGLYHAAKQLEHVTMEE